MQLLLLVSLVGFALSHNWLNSPSRTGDGSRSQKASTVKPAPAGSGEAHVQANPGQDFQVEWVIGHNRHTYFTLLSKKDQDKMAMVTTKLLDDYFNSAPAGMQGPPPKKYAKYHRKADMTLTWDTPSDKGVAQPQIANFFARRVPDGDQYHVSRDPIFKGSFRGARANRIDPKAVYQFEYKAPEQATDRWAMYKSDKYPFIIGAARYLHSRNQPSRPDFALVKFPADAEFGEYIVQYQWSGYYDAIDVQIIPNPVSQPYGGEIPAGQIPPPAVFNRIDHCWYPESKLAGTCLKMTAANRQTEIQKCINECRAKKHEDCNGVVVIPIKPGNGVWKGFQDINLTPFGMAGCNKPAASDPATHVCYPLISREGSALDFEYWATSDPADPAFYSTCWHRIKPRVGFMPQASTFDPPAWEYRGKCISCADRRSFSDAKVTPIWSVEDTCVNCEAKLPTGPISPETLHYYAFEEGTGKDVTNLVDEKQYKLMGGAAFSTDAAVGKSSVKFGGVIADYINLGTFSITGNKFTMAAFVKFNSIDSSDPRVISKTSGDSQQNHIWALTTDQPTANGPFFPRCRLRVGTDTKELRGNKSPVVKQWHHWACTYDGAAIKLYLDGVEVGSMAATGNIATSNDPVIVGANTAAGKRTKPMDGSIDDLRLIQKALSKAEIAELIALKN